MKQINTIPVRNVSIFRKDANMFAENIDIYGIYRCTIQDNTVDSIMFLKL
jgi:hypothetical protein